MSHKLGCVRFDQGQTSEAVKIHRQTLCWCPSHGKKPEWRPSWPHDHVAFRELDQAADDAATEARDQAWHRGDSAGMEQEEVAAWSDRTLKRAHKALMRQMEAAGFPPEGDGVPLPRPVLMGVGPDSNLAPERGSQAASASQQSTQLSLREYGEEGDVEDTAPAAFIPDEDEDGFFAADPAGCAAVPQEVRRDFGL